MLEEHQRQALEALYRRLNPAALREQLDHALAALWKLAERPQAAKAASAR